MKRTTFCCFIAKTRWDWEIYADTKTGSLMYKGRYEVREDART